MYVWVYQCIDDMGFKEHYAIIEDWKWGHDDGTWIWIMDDARIVTRTSTCTSTTTITTINNQLSAINSGESTSTEHYEAPLTVQKYMLSASQHLRGTLSELSEPRASR